MLVVIDAVGIRMGGGAKLLLDYVEWLPKVRPEWEWVVYLLPRGCREFDAPPSRSSVRIETAPAGDSSLGRLWWLYRELPKQLSNLRADALFAFSNVASTQCPVPQVVYVQQVLAFRAQTWRAKLDFSDAKMRLLRRLIVRGALRSASAVVQTEDMRHRLECHSPRLVGRVHVVPGCVSSAGREEEIRPEKRRLIEGCAMPRLVYVAHAYQHKNHATLIQALPRIVAHYPSATLLLTVEPDARSATVGHERIRELRQLVLDLGVGKHVVWLGTLSAGEVRYLLRQATAAVFPSLDESFGLPLAEAVTEGCALAASDLPFAKEVAGAAAVYFNPLDPDSIAMCITELIARPELRGIVAQCQAKQSLRFKPESVAERIAAIIENAAHQGQPVLSNTGREVC